jgi:predicted Zn-dependent peptidase
VREHRGLAYSVYSYAAHYADAGTFAVAVGCLPSKVGDVLDVVRDELSGLGRDGISEVELQRGKGQLRGGMVLALEDSGSRMSRIAKAELLYDELPSIDEVLRRVDEVSLDDVNALARRLFRQQQTLAIVGPFDSVPG